MRKNIFIKKLTKSLSRDEIRKILNLKKNYWKYSLKSHLNWFNKNIKKNDIHFFFKKKTIKMYCCFRKRKIKLKNRNCNIFYLDTLCSLKKDRFRVLNFLTFIIDSAKTTPIVTLCRKEHVVLYSLFGFTKTSNINFLNHNVKDYFVLINIPIKYRLKSIFIDNKINITI